MEQGVLRARFDTRFRSLFGFNETSHFYVSAYRKQQLGR